MQQQQHEQEQAPKPNLGCAEHGGMQLRLGPNDNNERGDPARTSVGESAIPSAAAAPTAAGNAPREAVTLTSRGAEVHRPQQEQRGKHDLLQGVTQATARLSTSISSHGAAIGQGDLRPSSSHPSSATAATAENYEQQHVHSVYESIASHFSSTRYKPWPLVTSFLASIPPGSVGLDVGCGNGKYLGVNPDLFILGSDRSANLAQLARELKVASGATQSDRSSADVVGVADGLDLPFGGGGKRVDFAICIAVIHHFSTRDRRIEGVRALLDCVQPRTGKVLVYAWALEQGTSRRGWDEGTADQDQLVPWVLKTNKPKKSKKEETNNKENSGDGEETRKAETGVAEATYQRYYHLYRKGELEEDVVTAGGEVLSSGYEKDNWWAIASPKEETKDTTSESIISR
ncbi:S-adenosyl-L-methionine-dependent methyltransferase [Hypoxylon trugodes]|uniref:S-adenosyl-L-methionine-dependent methyltransferase n=1 Tax=Hypoxylon trugodes TaxID=326681 RepID=UPI0021988B59|nr:S-adenosyl-L-methionine-dependent methyltransferase [Hypoxylon trugodes]KAI1388763.1 S-adenosyl-L-methionine-dependent methyltransferase [Hypoxylon trugodes]